MNQNIYGMSTIICRRDIELGKKIKRKFDGDLGIILDLNKKLAPEKQEPKNDKKLEFERAMKELNEDLELIPLISSKTHPKKSSPVPVSSASGSPVPVSPASGSPVPVSPVQSRPVPTSPVKSRPVPVSPVKSRPVPTSPVIDPKVVNFSTNALAAKEILDIDEFELYDIKPIIQEEPEPEPEPEPELYHYDDQESEQESEQESDSDSDSDSDSESEDSDLENDFFSLDHITPDKYYSDLGTTTEVSVKANYLTKVGSIKRLSSELSISNYDTHLEKYGNEFLKGKKTIRPWEHKRYLTMLNYIEQLLITEKEKRNMDDISRKVICTGLDVVEKLTKGQVKIPIVNKVINTQNLSGVYTNISLGYKSEHRDLTNKITGGYRPSGAASLGIKFIIEILGKVDDDDSDDEDEKPEVKSKLKT